MRTEEEIREHCESENYDAVVRCDICGEEMTDDYVEIDGEYWCQRCFKNEWIPEHWRTL